MADPVLIALFEHKAWCNARLIEAFRAAPVTADRRTMAVALFTFDHTARVDRIFQSRLNGEAVGVDAIVAGARPDLDELARQMAATDAWYVDYVKSASLEALDTIVEFTFLSDGDAGRMSKAQMLAHVIAHGASHRGAIGRMLEEAGAAGAPDMVTTFLSGRHAVPAQSSTANG